MSELRASELLDDLCDDMMQYHWLQRAPLPSADAQSSGAAQDRPTAAESSAALDWAWHHKSVANATGPASPELKQRRRELKHFCYKMLEKHEDRLTQFLTAAEMGKGTGAHCTLRVLAFALVRWVVGLAKLRRCQMAGCLWAILM